MGQDQRINPGSFAEEMRWITPVKERNDYGEMSTRWEEGFVFLSKITKQSEDKGTEEHQKIVTKSLTFITWTHKITTQNRVRYDGVDYDVNSITPLQRGVFSEYACSYKSNNDA